MLGRDAELGEDVAIKVFEIDLEALKRLGADRNMGFAPRRGVGIVVDADGRLHLAVPRDGGIGAGDDLARSLSREERGREGAVEHVEEAVQGEEHGELGRMGREE